MRIAELSINPHTGQLVVRGADRSLLATLAAHLGHAVGLDCGECPPPTSRQSVAESQALGHVRVAGFLHQSMVDGPGLRSVVFMQGCHLRCTADCRNSHIHHLGRGTLMTMEAVLAELLRPDHPRDGITISGGEPMRQAQACAELVARLKGTGVHVVVYTGYIYEVLLAGDDPWVQWVLTLADMLVDGPYLAALREDGLAYRGSSNQRVIDLGATRSTGELRLLQAD